MRMAIASLISERKRTMPKKFRAALNIRQGAALEFMLDERHGIIIIQEYKLDKGRNGIALPCAAFVLEGITREVEG